jgi:hypothetical protein
LWEEYSESLLHWTISVKFSGSYSAIHFLSTMMNVTYCPCGQPPFSRLFRRHSKDNVESLIRSHYIRSLQHLQYRRSVGGKKLVHFFFRNYNMGHPQKIELAISVPLFQALYENNIKGLTTGC